MYKINPTIMANNPISVTAITARPTPTLVSFHSVKLSSTSPDNRYPTQNNIAPGIPNKRREDDEIPTSSKTTEQILKRMLVIPFVVP